MMRSLWNAASFLAVVHLLALLLFIGWLWQSDRLSAQRVGDIRNWLATPLHDARADAVQSLKDSELQRLRELEEQARLSPPLDSAALVQHAALVRAQEDAARRRLEDERRMLQQQLAGTQARLDANAAAIQRERAMWDEATKSARERKKDAQFLQTVKQYEQAPPRQAKRMLVELINENKHDQAVAYLNAMNARAASRVLKEFKTDQEIAVATELLESMRVFGLSAEADGSNALQSSSNADRASTAG